MRSTLYTRLLLIAALLLTPGLTGAQDPDATRAAMIKARDALLQVQAERRERIDELNAEAEQHFARAREIDQELVDLRAEHERRLRALEDSLGR
jgi:phage-related minor tail protein